MIQKVRLDWDTEFFGFPIEKIALSHEAHFSFESDLENGIFYYIFSDLPQSNFQDKLVDQKVVYTKRISETRKQIEVQSYHGELNTCLIDLAIASGEFSRFKIDDQLNTNFEKMYRVWLEKSIDRIIADEVFVFRIDEIIKGFVTVKIQSDHGIIGLIAVDKSLRGQGIGKKLILEVEHYLKGLKIMNLKVPTQLSNLKACKFYESLGFQKESLTYIYHINKL